KDDAARADYHAYLRGVGVDMWNTFVREFQKTWDQTDPINMPAAYREAYMDNLLKDSAGMAGCVMYRRVIGLAGVEDIRGIENVDDKTVAATVAMDMGHLLLMGRGNFNTIEDLMDAVEAVKPS
ncbi:MAG: hypothetical protein AAF125_22565, partial [Chloroflexota bacterium]